MSPKHLLFKTLFAAFSLAVFSSAALAESPLVDVDAADLGPEAAAGTLSGRELFERYDAANSGFVDAEVSLEMVLRDRNGREDRRELSYRELEVDGDGNKSLIVFDAPRAIKGTGLLSYSHLDRQDDQWLYLPALKRVKKVAARNKSGPFLGSEFAFEDMTAFELERFTYQLLGQDDCGDERCYQVERVPLDAQSCYSRHVVYMDTSALRIRQIDYYNREGELNKTVSMSDFRQLDNGMWRAHHMLMANHLSGRATELIWHDYRVGVGLDANRDFSVNALKRSR